MIVVMMLAFHSVSRAAAWMQMPYLLWASSAGYLNYMVWVMNP